MLNDVHRQSHLVMVVGQLAHLLNGRGTGASGDLAREVYLEILGNGGHEEAGEREGRLAEHVADQGLSDVATDGEAERQLCGDMEGCGLAAWSGRGCGV